MVYYGICFYHIQVSEDFVALKRSFIPDIKTDTCWSPGEPTEIPAGWPLPGSVLVHVGLPFPGGQMCGECEEGL